MFKCKACGKQFGANIPDTCPACGDAVDKPEKRSGWTFLGLVAFGAVAEFAFYALGLGVLVLLVLLFLR